MSSKSIADQTRHRDTIDATDRSAQSPMLSRSIGLPSSMGKATCTVKTLVPDCVNDDLVRVARESGFEGVSDFLRDMILVRLYGVEQVASMRQRRLELAAGIGTEKGRA